MPTRRIEKNQWQTYFDRVSQQLTTSNIDVEVDAPELGAQQEASHLPVVGFSYDPRDDAFSIVSEDLEHRISRPQEISVREVADDLRAIEVVDFEGHRHIAKLSKALKLPLE